MTTSEIQSKIYYYGGRISNCDTRMSELNTKINQATQIYNALFAFKKKAGELNDARKNKMSGAVSTSYESKILSTYYEGMNATLTGVGYTNAYDNLENGCAEVKNKIDDWGTELTNVASERNANVSSKSYWESQLKYASDAQDKA